MSTRRERKPLGNWYNAKFIGLSRWRYKDGVTKIPKLTCSSPNLPNILRLLNLTRIWSHRILFWCDSIFSLSFPCFKYFQVLRWILNGQIQMKYQLLKLYLTYLPRQAKLTPKDVTHINWALEKSRAKLKINTWVFNWLWLLNRMFERISISRQFDGNQCT